MICAVPDEIDHYYFSAFVVGGVGCGQRDVPGFYSNVAKHREWIEDKMEDNDLELADFNA